MTKNKILCLLLGVLICLNVSLLNYKKTYAYIPSADPASMAVNFMQAFAQTIFFNYNQQEGNASDDALNISIDFLEDLQNNNPTLYNALAAVLSVPSALSPYDSNYKVGTFNIPEPIIKSLFTAFNGYIAAHGVFDSETGDYKYEYSSVSSDCPVTYFNTNNYGYALNELYNSYTGSSLGTGWSNWYFDSSDIVTVVVGYNNGNSFFYVVNGDFPDCVNGTYPTGVTTSCSGFYIAHTNNKYNSDWVYTPYEILGKFIYNPSGSAVDDSPAYGPALPTKFNLSDIAAGQAALDSFVDNKTSVTSDHASDGTVTNERSTSYRVIVQEQTNEETGEDEYVPVGLHTSTELGFPIDNSFAKPTDPPVTHPLVDSETGEVVKVGAVTGAVSITDFGQTALEGLKGILRTILQPIQACVTALSNVFSDFWNDLLNLLRTVFVPDLTPITSSVAEFKTKFTFIEQFDLLWRQLLNRSFSPLTEPKFSFNLPSLFFKNGSYQAKECLVVDFTVFVSWRGFLDNVIVILAYLAYFKKMYATIPTLFGFASNVSSVHSLPTNTTVSSG